MNKMTVKNIVKFLNLSGVQIKLIQMNKYLKIENN
jgi:hypothetical protein